MNSRNDKRRYDLPPLSLLRGFEAAARLGSFTKAADELAVTQSAISKQLKLLEDDLGAELFERKPRALLLTEEGRRLQQAIVEALDRLQATVDQVRRTTSATEVNITTTTGFASLWLIPRLHRFRARFPELDVRISATTSMLDLKRDRIDLAVRFCPPHMVPPGSPRLFGEENVPVCSPRLLEDPARPLRRPADLVHHTLLRYEVREFKGSFMDWDTWLAALGLADLKPAATVYFNQTDQTIQAAIGGQGIALGQSRLVAEMLASRLLVAPFGPGVAGARAFFVVRADADRRPPRRSNVDAFVDWLIEEAGRGPA